MGKTPRLGLHDKPIPMTKKIEQNKVEESIGSSKL